MAEVTGRDDSAARHDHDEEAARVGNNDYSSEEEREGRFHGPDASWRFYTKAERDLAYSLDQTENNDLSAHLYNAHNLKRRLYVDSVPEPWHSKQRWIAHDDSGHIPFHPESSWTAWPLEPADVPRSSEQWGVPAADGEDENETFRKREDWTPGGQLRDCIHAEILRQAKDRFKNRVSTQNVTGSASLQGHGNQAPQLPSTDNSESDTATSSSSQSSDEIRDEPEESDAGVEAPDSPGAPDGILYAVPMADDELAASIARPAVNHIMAKLDDLLRGLHHSRKGHRRRRSQTRSENATRRHKSTSGADSDDENDNSRSQSRSSRHSAGDSSPRNSRKRQELGTRDWSEVLGIAALTGWDQAVVARAAQRCATLFDEHMEFRTIHMTATMKDSSERAHPERDAETSPANVSTKPFEASRSIESFCCPHTSCSRHQEPYSQLWRLREHLKRKHKHAAHEVDTMVGDLKQALAYEGSVGQLAGMTGSQHEQVPGSNFSHSRSRPVKDEYLQPILINIGRSKDKKVRRTPSREHLRKAASSQQDTEDDGEEDAM
ncbi:Putative Rrn9 domain-containing protein [Septoria linicola]|uniref:Rrn9 domain-containing protein n=1 Tax=Septoria linicola TaxID=215465 RepID=A0A9Q9AIA1_9PEZI|nr:putative Rrn9 domain-containing protein [Septoria linicola]USW46930.1 Putative Rrn9 domain-containing protein [Septoria linicola]